MKKLVLLTACATSLLGMNLSAQTTVETVIDSDLFEPYAVAVDTNNNYYISDSANNRLLKFVAETATRTNFAGAVGPLGRGYVDGAAHLARFNNPQGIVAARNGFVVADAGNHRIRFVALDGTVSTLAGGTAGFTDGAGATAQFNAPSGLTADAAGNIYIADLLNNAVRKLDLTNGVSTLATGFLRPSAVTVGDAGFIFVADQGNHSIRAIDTLNANAVTLIAGSGSRFISGYVDSVVATEARFITPRGLLWVGGSTGLLVADSGNHVLRTVFYNAAVGGYSVATLGGVTPSSFVTPVGLVLDTHTDVLITDIGNHTLLRIAATQAPKPVTAPSIGLVELIEDAFTSRLLTKLFPVSSSTFNNDVVIAILAESGTETFYTFDGTDPTSNNGLIPPPYENGNAQMPTSIVDTSAPGASPDITIRAISTATGRRASDIVTARIRFKVSNPAIIGNNPASVLLENGTTNALMYYTVDGTDPTQGSPLYVLGSKLNIVNGTNDVVLKVKAFRNGYESSRTISKVFSITNVKASSVGVTRDFLAGIGSTIVVPVDVDLNTNDVLQSLQFRVEVAPNGGAPLVSDQVQILQFDSTNSFVRMAAPSTNLPTAVVYTNSLATGMLIGYFGTNAAFSISGRGTVALLSIPIPVSAVEGQTYTLSVIKPSGTSDGFEDSVALTPLTNRTITVTNLSYVVGDTALSTWYNAGDFGNGNLNNNDVNNAFYASLDIRPPYPFTDLFDAMDSYPEDAVGTVGGDGIIGFNDWQVILSRSLRLNTNNWSRTWTVGGFRAVVAGNLNELPNMPAESQVVTISHRAWETHATLSATVLENVEAGQVVSVPLTLTVAEGASVSGLAFRVNVFGGPTAVPVTEGVTFTAGADIPTPGLTVSGPAMYGAGWPVGSFRPALTGTKVIGKINFTVPSNAKQGDVYMVRFWKAGGSTQLENGHLANYRFESTPGAVWVQSGALKAPDAISDEWRLHFFGRLQHALNEPFADPDGDGVNNLQEFLAGSHPSEPRIHRLVSEWRRAKNTGEFKLRWLAQPKSTYVIETSTDMVTWVPLTTVISDDLSVREFIHNELSNPNRFYRIRPL